MKSLLFIQNMDSDDDKKKIEDELSQTRLDFEVVFDKKMVVIMGGNDLVYLARTTLKELGYIVK